MRTLIWAIMVLLTGALCAVAEETPYHAGFMALEVEGSGAGPVAVGIWYPTLEDETVWQGSHFEISAARDAPVAPGRFRLILLSHGSGGDQFHHHDWARYLARRGFVVAAMKHPGDSLGDIGGRGSDIQLTGRLWDTRHTLDAVLADPRIGPSIDATRIGMVGYSAGGYTSIASAGGRPDYALWGVHCAAHPEDDELCPVDGSWVPPRITRPDWELPPPLAEIGAAVAMAPSGIMFDKAGLAGIDVPIRLYRASGDSFVRNVWNADNVAANLPRPPEFITVPGDHFIFLAPCPAALAEVFPEACQDPPGVDRATLHRQIAAELVDFFDRTLGPDVPTITSD